MRVVDPEEVEAVWAATASKIPAPANNRPVRGHRPRIPDKTVFTGLLIRLVSGCSRVTAAALTGYVVSDTTMRSRHDEWVAAGCSTR